MGGMADKIKVFLALAAGLAGIVLLANVGILGPFWFHWETTTQPPFQSLRVIEWVNLFQAVLGVVLLAAAITYFWTRSRFYRS
jgi:hypothetical protein